MEPSSSTWSGFLRFPDSFDLNVPFTETMKNLEGKTPPSGFKVTGTAKREVRVPIMARMVLPVNTLELGRRGDNGCATWTCLCRPSQLLRG